MHVDNETKVELTAAEHIRQMTESEGWAIVYAKLTDKILDLQNINNVDDSSPEKAIADMKARKMAAGILFQWAKQEVYGRLEAQTNTQAALADKEEVDYVDRG